MDPLGFIGRNCLYTGAAGIGVGFVVLGILPFIEKAFRITTSMTLLELADVNHPLIKRLSAEAPVGSLIQPGQFPDRPATARSSAYGQRRF